MGFGQPRRWSRPPVLKTTDPPCPSMHDPVLSPHAIVRPSDAAFDIKTAWRGVLCAIESKSYRNLGQLRMGDKRTVAENAAAIHTISVGQAWRLQTPRGIERQNPSPLCSCCSPRILRLPTIPNWTQQARRRRQPHLRPISRHRCLISERARGKATSCPLMRFPHLSFC